MRRSTDRNGNVLRPDINDYTIKNQKILQSLSEKSSVLSTIAIPGLLKTANATPTYQDLTGIQKRNMIKSNNIQSTN